MLNHSFVFNGHSSDEFGIKIERFPGLNRPARKYTVSNVPGRNGNLYEMQDAWEEVIQSYEIYAGGQSKNSPQDFMRIMEWLCEPSGYAELTDSYDVDHYREAVFVDATDIANSWNRFGRAVVSFRCRPERFLDSGRNMVLDFTNTTLIGYVNTWSLTLRESAPSGTVIGTLHEGEVLKILDSVVISSVGWYQVKTEDGTTGWCQSQYVLTYNALIINNPTKHIAKPKITLTMRSGGLWMMLNRSILEVTGQAYPLYIDCETENITGINGLGQPESYNNRATLSDGDGNPISSFLSLKSGENYISIEESENVSDVTIEPRFWEL